MAQGAFPPAPFEPSPDFRAWLDWLAGTAPPPRPQPDKQGPHDER
jgi:hypothetical protein